VSDQAPATSQDPITTDGDDPRIECEFPRGRDTWRFVCPRSEAGATIEAAFTLADAGELDRFDVSWLSVLIDRALSGSGSEQTTTQTSRRRKQAPTRLQSRSRMPWSKD